MDLKKQKKYLNKCLRVLKGKKSYKIRTFTDLAKAIKITVKTFRIYELNNNPEIKEILQKNRQENKPEKSKKKTKPKLPQKKVKIEDKLPQKNEIEEKKVLPKIVNDMRMRSFAEVNAKLFAYQSFKKKNYSRMTESAKRLIDRQIGILEWILFKDKKEEIGGYDVNDNSGG